MFLFAAYRETAPAIAGWLDAGHEVAGIVVPSRRRKQFKKRRNAARAGMWSVDGQTARIDPTAPVVFVDETSANSAIHDMLDQTDYDLVISVYWPRKLPEDIIQRGKMGVVNFHPAMLPYYRGPAPFSAMVVDDNLANGAGMTLHLMDETLDTGPIIAQARLPQSTFGSRHAIRAAMGSAMYLLARDALTEWTRGEVTPMPQKPGGNWAGLGPLQLSANWPAEKLLRISRMTQSSKRKRVEIRIDGEVITTPPSMRRIGARSGQPVERKGSLVTFDCADARIEARPSRSWLRTWQRFNANRALEREGVTEGIVLQRGADAPGALKP